MADKYNDIYEQISLYEEFAQAVHSPDTDNNEDDEFETKDFPTKQEGGIYVFIQYFLLIFYPHLLILFCSTFGEYSSLY